MNKIRKMIFKPLTAVLIITGILLASCSSLTFPTTVCHATGDTANPYSGVTVNNAEELLAHRDHASDIFPMPAGGCPANPGGNQQRQDHDLPRNQQRQKSL